jgi:hypothetical protein
MYICKKKEVIMDIKPRKASTLKGHPKWGGRAKGTPNKISVNLKTILADKLESFVNNIDKELEQIKQPDKKVAAIAQLLPFIMPRYSSTAISADTERDINAEDFIKDLDKKYKKIDVKIDMKKLTIVGSDELSSENSDKH